MQGCLSYLGKESARCKWLRRLGAQLRQSRRGRASLSAGRGTTRLAPILLTLPPDCLALRVLRLQPRLARPAAIRRVDAFRDSAQAASACAPLSPRLSLACASRSLRRVLEGRGPRVPHRRLTWSGRGRHDGIAIRRRRRIAHRRRHWIAQGILCGRDCWRRLSGIGHWVIPSSDQTRSSGLRS